MPLPRHPVTTRIALTGGLNASRTIAISMPSGTVTRTLPGTRRAGSGGGAAATSVWSQASARGAAPKRSSRRDSASSKQDARRERREGGSATTREREREREREPGERRRRRRKSHVDQPEARTCAFPCRSREAAGRQADGRAGGRTRAGRGCGEAWPLRLVAALRFLLRAHACQLVATGRAHTAVCVFHDLPASHTALPGTFAGKGLSRGEQKRRSASSHSMRGEEAPWGTRATRSGRDAFDNSRRDVFDDDALAEECVCLPFQLQGITLPPF